VTTRCKRCVSKRVIQLRRQRGIGPRNKNSRDGERRCTKCGTWQPATQFYTHAAACKQCVAKYGERLRRSRGVKPKRVADSVQVKIANALRCRMWHALKGDVKITHTLEILGCNLDLFKVYMERRFKPGMTWDNYGHKGWHIGHIKDCCAFDLSDPAQQRQCFHYTNMEPQWALDNWKKPRMLANIGNEATYEGLYDHRGVHDSRVGQ
jgi:hypothetical protein